METASRLELHYYFDDDRHQIDSVVRNKCEAELLALYIEAAEILNINVQLLSEAYQEGGFKEFWKFLGKNTTELSVLLLVIQILLTSIPLFDHENQDLEKELNRLSIEEKKLSIEKLKHELQQSEYSGENLDKAAKLVDNNLKIIKRKSNFYAQLEKYQLIKGIGFTPLNSNWTPVVDEIYVKRNDFSKFILSTNKLRSVEDDNAIIEIVSPVLKEGRYKWKGIYDETSISFDMQDSAFKDAVLLENIPFRHGSAINCVLTIHREIDEIGGIKITGYSVPTVIAKIDGDMSFQTSQGMKYLHTKKLIESQADLFNEKT